MKTVVSQKTIKAARGFTLIELLITLIMLAILVSLAAPSFNSTIRDNRTLAAANSLVAAVASARSEALKRGRMVSICPSANGTSCSGDWGEGWIVYMEKTTVVAGGSPDPDGAALLVGEKAGKLQLTQAAGNKWMRFSPRGLAEASVSMDVKPSTCNTGYNYQELVFGVTGRPVMTKKTC